MAYMIGIRDVFLFESKYIGSIGNYFLKYF